MACNTNDQLQVPDEIWMEIFLRCTVESLLRANCVCKQWHALIINPDFTSTHLRYQKIHNKGRLLLQHFVEETQQYRYILFDDETLTRDTYHELDRFGFSEELIHMEGPIDGLYCLFNRSDRIVLWNPALRNYKILPLPHPHFLPHMKVYEGQIGFGIDPLTNNYKLVLIRAFDNTINYDLSDLYVTVYNFATNAWTLLDLGDFPLTLVSDNLNSSFLNGTYYWSDNNLIYAFDMGKELFREILGPDISHSEFSFRYLTIDNDRLALLLFREFNIDVWVMLDEGVWIKPFSITHPTKFDMPAALWKTDGLLFATSEDREFCGNPDSQMVLCNIITQGMRNVGPRGLKDCYQASIYYESLVSVDCGTEHKGKHASLNMVSDFLNVDHNPYLDTKRPGTSFPAFDENGNTE